MLVSISKRISGSRNKIMVRISTSCNRVRINPDPDSHKKSRCFPLNETLPDLPGSVADLLAGEI
jgi:hypothetical protein